MKLKSYQEETIMFQSRLLCEHEGLESTVDRSLALTIHLTTLRDTVRIQNAIFQKIHRSIYGGRYSPDKFTFSMLIAGDVESSRSGYVPVDVLKTPLYPHYHCLMVFSEGDWAIISPDLSAWIAVIRNSIAEIKEVKNSEINDDGCYISESVWIKKFEPKLDKHAKYASALADYIQYIIKADLIANKQSIDTYRPMVFPHDINKSPALERRSSMLFNELHEQEIKFQSQRMRS
tara:strand:+ start:1503 stop:2201 length:699 start_codon:yes stop_codon:yes gene_type:complete